jgi:5-methylcytosine-specific restriction endonuclease McrA
VRAAWLRAHPVCAGCGRQDHLQVHHILPVHWPNGAAHELDEANFITLCENPVSHCHLWLGHLGDWKARNPTVVADADYCRRKIQSRPHPK